MDREEFSATNWVMSRLVVLLLALAGVFFLAEPDWLGFGAVARALGGKDHLQAFGLGIAFFVLAAQSWEKTQIRLRAAETIEALHQLLYGKDYRRDREAIEILLTALESKNAENATAAYTHLVRLTGQNFAQDPKVWRSWWAANKKRFERKKD